ncbi:hypothetical protein EUX98_g2516 [Antrodiella citrinella]|uniref:SAC3/GANP/THP3 conserved domain-containing protein n=1 Tax=Antrodiella citrinella TaxID=2447956 RepID=A0A4S4N1R4_9APHY|nr:hypothetical protein EUX98_g2516 [Antrodiella citrinella]
MDEFQIRGRGRGNGERRGTHKNKHWVAGHENGVHSADNEKWERGGYRGGRGRGVRGRGGGSGRSTPFLAAAGPLYDDATSGAEDEAQDGMDATDTEIEVEGTEVDDPEERERYWKELVKARELEKKRMIAEKKWADPDAPMRLEDAITPVGTCTDMCPKFERYRREREHNLDKWEVIPGTKRVDHARAVKMYERASGSKSLPSDLRTPEACRLITGPIAIECHDRCARFHIVAMHVQRDVTGFDLRLEEQQLSHSLLSLQQFYEDQRGQYTSPTELEMRVYQRLISVRNLKERHEDVPVQITSHPVFQLTTRFLHHVQKESAPISRSSALRVGQEGMQIFGELAAVLREQHNTVMIYLTACILERLFGKDTIEDMESVRGSLTISDIIDGSQSTQAFTSSPDTITEVFDDPGMTSQGPAPMARSATEWLASNFGSQPAVPVSATTPSVPPATQGINGGSIPQPPRSAFANINPTPAGTSSAQTPFPLTLPQGKGKAKEVEVDLDELAKVFKREHSPFVKCFRKWLKRTTDLALWEEACRRGEAYREKKEREKLSNSRRGALDKSSSKRRASSGTEPDSYAKKRARRRKSTDYKAAVTDEQLVQQLKENHEEHQRRWAHGSFLEAIRRRVEALSPDGDSPDAWRAWLSLNTDNDGTAIWLEHKFDMPQSGEWISDTVFSVPAVPKAQAGRMPLGSPGLVIFERTPLGDVEDAIERKYRVLDDCARLRDIVDGLSSDSQMRFLPSLLVINWQNAGEQDILRDFADMTESFVQAGHLKNVYTFAVSSTDKDLDKTFEQLVGGVDLEVEDRLVQTVSWQVDWPRYNDVLSSIKEAQTQAVLGILAVLGKHAQVDIEIPVDMEAPAHLGMEYATGPFLNAFEKLTIAAAERLLGDKPQSSYTVLKERVSTASKTFQGTLESISSRLRESGVGILLQWSKRRADDDIDSPSTPKRLRPSISRETSDDTDNSVLEDSPPMGPPSTLATSTAGYSEPVEKPTVTAAMLRALARDILKSR